MYNKIKSFASPKVILTYFTVRFPPIPLGLYVMVTSLGIGAAFLEVNLKILVGVASLYFLFLLHLRILDEFKDYNYDSLHHPDRPVQQGLVTLSTIKVMGIGNGLVMILLALVIAPPAGLPFFLLAFSYTFFMFKEFFVPEFLRKQPILYLLSHQIVFFPLFLFFYSVFNRSPWSIGSVARFSRLLYTILPILLIEIGRKLKHRYDREGRETNDTYVYLWGERGAIRFFAVIVLAAGLLSANIPGFNLYLWQLLIVASFLIFLGSMINPAFITNHSMGITTALALSLPLMLLL